MAGIVKEEKFVKKPKNRFRSANIDNTCSAYELQTSGHQDSFCGATISWYNPFLRYFQTFSCLFTAACLFLAPYQYFFKASETIFHLNTVCDMIYFCVILFRSRTSHMIDGVEERNLLKVRRRYQTSVAFILDLITYFPLAQRLWPFTEYDEVFYALNRQTILIRLHYILFYLEIRENESGSSTILYRTTKYFLLSTLTLHFTACGWYGLACTRTDETIFSLDLCLETSWIRYLPQNILEKVMSATKNNDTVVTSEVSFLHNTYITSLYWASGTVTSTGYGDIHAFTVGEKIYSLFTMLIGMCILYGMTMGGLTSMLTNIDARRSAFVHRYQAFEREVNRMDVSDEVKIMCLNYFDYLWRRWEGEDVYESDFLNILPECLRASFAEARFCTFLQKADLLADTENAFIRNLSLVSKPMVFLENQFIQKSGEICDIMCFLHHGIAEVLDHDESEVVALMNPGKLFGQVMLVYDLPRINSIKCRTNCDVFVLTKSDFRNALAEYPDSAQKFIAATQRKCSIPGSGWPMEPPSNTDFLKCLEKSTTVRQRRQSISTPESKIPSTSTLTTRRMTTIHSTNYSGIDLSRVQLRKKPQEVHDNRSSLHQDRRISLVDFLIHGDTNHPHRSATWLQDGTEMIATNDNYEDLKAAVSPGAGYLDPDYLTLRSRLYKLTIINPNGRFYKIWLDFLFVVSVVAGLYPTFIAFFTTTPGEQTLYTNPIEDNLYGREILDMATDTCNSTQNLMYKNCPPWPFNETVKCLKAAGGSFAWRIVGNESTGFRVHLPATYDISRVAYYSMTEKSNIHLLISILFIDVPFYLNILINFRTEVYTPNGFLTSFKDIARNYNKWNKLWLDIFGIFPFEAFYSFFGCSKLASYHSIAFLRLNRVLFYFRHVPMSFSRWEYSLNVKIANIRTLKFLIYIYSITHVCACFFYWWSCGYITQSEVDNLVYKCRFGSWAWVFDISYLTHEGDDYIKTMYWASTTMTSTGYGDISASTTTGRVFALFTMIIGTLLYGWLVAVVASTVSNSEAAEVEFTNSMLDTKNYLAVHLVPNSLVSRVMNVRRIEWERYAGTATPGKQMIGKELSKNLHNVLFYESLSDCVVSLPFFRGVDPSFVAMLCKHIKIYHYSEGDMVIYEGDLSRNLYIIKKGHCNIVSEDLESKLDHLTAGDYFGECEVLFGCGSPRTVVAETACELLVLQRDEIDEVLECFPLLQAQMMVIKNDTEYQDRVLAAIKRRNISSQKEHGPTTARYKTESVQGEFKMYTDRLKTDSMFIKLGASDKKLQLNCFSKFISLFLLPYAFDPLSKSYLVYETMRMVLIFTTIIIVPFQMAFLPSNFSLMLLQYILDGLSLVDQYIKAHTSYFNERAVLVTHPARTAIQYFKTSFLVDFLSWFPFEMILYLMEPETLSESQWRLLGILRFTRLLQLYKVKAYFSFWLSGIREANRLIKTFRNIMFGLMSHHWVACILFLAACHPDSYNKDEEYEQMPEMIVMNSSGGNSYTQNTSWIGTINARSVFPSLKVLESYGDQYAVSFYWATSTLVCVGYGDIHAQLPTEMLLATLSMIFGTVFYSFILGAMAADTQTDDMSRAHYKDRLSDIRKFFKVYDVSKETQQQVLSYYCYLWDRTGGVSPDKLFTGLPPSIRTSLCQSMYGPMIREAFDEGENIDKETRGFFRLLSTHITPSLYLKRSVICRRNDIGNEMFFIQRGRVAIFDDDETTILKVLGPGHHFGEVALLFAVPRSKTIKAATNCELNVLTKKDLDNILEKFPQFREKMTAVAQDRRLKGTRSSTYEHHSSQLALDLSSMHSRVDKRVEKRTCFKPGVINKDSKFTFVRENITVFLALLSGSICFYQACFFSHSPTLYIIGYVFDAWFIVDMFINFHSSFYDQFSTNIDLLPIIQLHYAKCPDLFVFDAIANAPLELFGIFFSDLRLQLSILCYARLNRILRIYRMMKIFSSWEKDIRNNALVVRLYQSLLGAAFCINCLGGLWYALACQHGTCQEHTWISAKLTNYIEKQVYGYHLTPWVDCVYWAVSTMTSTGYGDIRPLARMEMFYSCFVMVLGKIMIGYILGMVAATLANDESLTVWYKQNLSAVKHCMSDHKFDKKLFNHVVQYYEYMWMKNQGVNIMELFPDLSFSLRADIYSQICGGMVNSMELFEGCPDNFLRHLCMTLMPTAYMPGDYICLQGDVRSETFLIYRGVAEAEENRENEKVFLRLVMEGEQFLSQSVLCKIRRPYSLRARTYVDVFSMTMDGLQSVMKYHPVAQEVVFENARRLYPELNL